MYTAKDLKVRDGIADGTIVWLTNFIDKANYPVYLFVCIYPEGNYGIDISDRFNPMASLNEERYPTLPKAVKVIMDYAKENCKLKHYV